MIVDNMHSNFMEIKTVMQTYGWECKNIREEVEGKKYGACSFDINNHHIVFRVGNITPTKVGQFVTLWKRIGNGPIVPYDLKDSVDLFVIAARIKNNFGVFVFPKSVLYEKGVISKDGRGGKRAMRLYPAWDKTDSFQAKSTQTWQLNYFFEINKDQLVLSSEFKKLFV